MLMVYIMLRHIGLHFYFGVWDMLLAKSGVKLTAYILALIAVSILQLGMLAVRGRILSAIWWLV